ncbi:unnamed protein product [Hyaloperonospora brassicae]|uniref:RRM domain-containing protein n=1 Tax=Hyaloperonospora brassicae TaxID=162125 RepID=A0AAV0V0G3_HYABA|nr:unnamed protein product [Hyaloperonospora brassicae]CAI5742717.1 unnamed protein product [Hyaloperonospora brassicae]
MTIAPPKTVKCESKAVNAATARPSGGRRAHAVVVTRVPSALCASEDAVRQLFAAYGALSSVTIHHNFLDMAPDGFVFLDYADKAAAEAAVAAVDEQRVGVAATWAANWTDAVPPSALARMDAALALARGVPHVEEDEVVTDLLLGRQEVNRFTQSQQEWAQEDDLILQSLSQHSLTSSQPKQKKQQKQKRDKRRQTAESGVDARGAKKTRR